MLKEPLFYILKGIVTSKGIRLGARFLGRSAGVVGWVVSGVSSVKMYKTYLKNDEHNKNIAPLEAELEKWNSAISCIGRNPYHVGDICSIDEGGSINSLGKKELFSIPNTRYGSEGEKVNMEYHAAPNNRSFKKKHDRETEKSSKKFPRFIEPCPFEARMLIQKAVDCIQTTEDIINIKDFQTKKDKFVEQLTGIRDKIKIPYEPDIDYAPVQQELSNIVCGINGVEFEYQSRILKLENERFKRRMKYATIAVGSLALGGLINIKAKKPN